MALPHSYDHPIHDISQPRIALPMGQPLEIREKEMAAMIKRGRNCILNCMVTGWSLENWLKAINRGTSGSATQALSLGTEACWQ